MKLNTGQIAENAKTKMPDLSMLRLVNPSSMHVLDMQKILSLRKSTRETQAHGMAD